MLVEITYLGHTVKVDIYQNDDADICWDIENVSGKRPLAIRERLLWGDVDFDNLVTEKAKELGDIAQPSP